MNQKVKTLSSRQLNVTNSYQTEAKRVLCVCTAGILRSPTAANVLNQEFGYNTRSCGVDERFALIPLDEVLLEWADEIVVMEATHAKAIYDKFPNFLNVITCLDIPDFYNWGDPKLKELIKKRYNESLEDMI